MQRTNIIQLLPTKNQKKILKEMQVLSSCVYNMANYIVRQQLINKEKVSSFYDLQQQLQTTDDYKLLGRSYSLPKLQKYGETNSARFKLITSKTQKKVGLPKYYKNRKTNTTLPSNLLFDNSQYSIKKHHVVIPLSRQMRKKYNLKKFHIQYNGILNHKGMQKRGEIVFKDGHFYLYQSVEIKTPEPKIKINSIGVDLGVKRLLASITTQNKELIIGSSRFYKQWCYYNELISLEQQYVKTQFDRRSSKKLQRLFSKRKKYQKQLFDNVIAKFYRHCKRNNVTHIYVGNPENITGDKGNKKTNSMINNYWSYNIFLHKLSCKAEEYGLTLVKLNEAFTSMTCPECGHASHKNKKDRIFYCVKCQHLQDRDIIGARNILSLGMYDQITSVHRDEVVPLEVSL